MKKLLFVFLSFFFVFFTIACNGIPSTTTSISITTTTSNTTTSETTLDLSSINVSAYSSNDDYLFESLPSQVSAWNQESNVTLSINVDETTLYQPYYGAGAAFTYSSAYVISQSPYKDEIMNYLFSESGLHLQLIRLTVGASDFVTNEIGHYTYNDTVLNSPDLELTTFSLEKDRIIIDLLKQALEINPNITFMASPWSAPAWMKTNKNLYGGALKPSYYDVYGDYLVKYLEEMANEGIYIDYLSVQNEPYHAAWNYPGMVWDVSQTVSFINESLGPKIASSEMDTKIMIWDHNPVDESGNYIDFPLSVLEDETANSFVDAIGVHCYSGSETQIPGYVDYLLDNAPDKEVFMTECTAVTAFQDLESNMEWSIRRMYSAAYNKGASGTTYWNLALNADGSPSLGGCQTCTGLVSVPFDNPNGFRLEADGYISGHFSKDIESGATRLYAKANNSSLITTGFIDQQGKITLVVFNDSIEREVKINWRGNHFLITLPQNSLTTLYWEIPN